MAFLALLAEAEIGQFGHPTMDKGVLGLQVAVDQFILHHLLHSLQHLAEDSARLILGQGTAPFFVEELSKIPAVTQRTDDVDVGGLFENVAGVDHVVTFEGGESQSLLLEKLG